MLTSCFSKIDETSIIGRYYFNTHHSDIIDVYKNHTYIHRYTNSGGKIFECHGKWEYNSKDIAFYGFNFFNDTGPAGGAGIWNSEVTENDGKVQLIYSDDDNSYFGKN